VLPQQQHLADDPFKNKVSIEIDEDNKVLATKDNGNNNALMEISIPLPQRVGELI